MKWLLLLLCANAHAGNVVEQLAWLPDDTHTIMGTSAERQPMLHLLRQTIGEKLPACWPQQQARIDSAFQVWRQHGDKAALVLHGKLVREEVEACLVDALVKIGVGPELRRVGGLTQLAAHIRQEPTVLWLGWNPQWIVADGDRARVEQLLAAMEGHRQHPTLDALLAAGDPSQSFWGVGDEDMTTNLLGVPSLGYRFWLEPGPRFRARLVFASAAEASRALGEIKRAAALEGFPAPIHEALVAISPKQTGSVLLLDMTGFASAVGNPEIGQKMIDLLKARLRR
jgi:hypothetical protein